LMDLQSRGAATVPHIKEKIMTKKRQPTPNNQRSMVKNPNNPAYKAAQDNRANQLNPNHPLNKNYPRGGSKK